QERLAGPERVAHPPGRDLEAGVGELEGDQDPEEVLLLAADGLHHVLLGAAVHGPVEIRDHRQGAEQNQDRIPDAGRAELRGHAPRERKAGGSASCYRRPAVGANANEAKMSRSRIRITIRKRIGSKSKSRSRTEPPPDWSYIIILLLILILFLLLLVLLLL